MIPQNGMTKQVKVAAAKARKEARRAFRKKLESEATETIANLGLSATAVDVEASKSNAHRPLPAPPKNLTSDSCTICLFYQYKEPAWTSKSHKAALNKVTELAMIHNGKLINLNQSIRALVERTPGYTQSPKITTGIILTSYTLYISLD